VAPILIVAAIGAPILCNAQAEETASQASGGVHELDEIVVTAQRRSERLQDVPIAVTAISGETADVLGVRDTESLNFATPGLNLARGTYKATVFLRGVGSFNQTAAAENSVAFYVDGVYMQSQQAAVLEFNNVDRVEVLKGPQGTLFGRNATGGVIHVITRRPSFDPSVEATVGYANYDRFESGVYATSGFSDSVAADIAVRYSTQDEGLGENQVTGNDVYTSRFFGARSKVLLLAGEDTEITFAGDYMRFKDQAGTALHIPQGSLGLDGSGYPGFYNTNESFDGYSTSRQYGGSVHVDHDFGPTRFVSITAYRDVRGKFLIDQDRAPIPAIRLETVEVNKTFTQEFQLQSGSDSQLTWIAGAFFLHDKNGYLPLTVNRTVQYVEAVQKTRSYALFGQATYPLTTTTNVTGGLRFTRDEREMDGLIQSPQGNTIYDGTLKDTFEEPTWRLSLDHRFTDDVLGYVSYNRGFKSGIFSGSNPTQLAVNPEILDAYEIGVKTEWLDRRLRVNAAVFRYDFDDLQFSAVNQGQTSLFNAADARITGGELEITAVPVSNLTVQATLSVLDGEYRKFPGAVVFAPAPAGGNQQLVIDASGFESVQTPPVTASLGVTYDIPIAEGGWSFGALYYYNDGFYWNVDRRLHEDSYHIVNGSIRYRTPSGRFDVTVWGKNLLDEKYSNYTNSNGQADQVSPAAPRTYGVLFGFNF
jgi:iron complex outermembrane receptor protein